MGVLLCEILTAVFLSLFVHGLATHSSNELFHIVAHPLSSKLWVAVFGGGARLPMTGISSTATGLLVCKDKNYLTAEDAGSYNMYLSRNKMSYSVAVK